VKISNNTQGRWRDGYELAEQSEGKWENRLSDYHGSDIAGGSRLEFGFVSAWYSGGYGQDVCKKNAVGALAGGLLNYRASYTVPHFGKCHAYGYETDEQEQAGC
jgi:hypothetical protein